MMYLDAKDEAECRGTLRSHNFMMFPRMQSCGAVWYILLSRYQETWKLPVTDKLEYRRLSCDGES